ncbi:ATP-binding protein [Cohnella sp. JJ-181]|uniref:ATP-binding protein n=1 Tax=Cohnella rhizoplanae TaxID=2974897 RepID=UPI0022FF5AE2|nr:ATP-binding protein [Cohnella sp. JJ-181]CAI6043783.1 Sporulation kinase A [Cohnella sp. JJ-181]
MYSITDQELLEAYSSSMESGLDDEFIKQIRNELIRRDIVLDRREGSILTKMLGKAELDYDQLVKYSLEAIFVLQNWKVIYVNQTGFNFLGLSFPDEIIGVDIRHFLHPDYHGVINEQHEIMNSSAPVELVEQKMIRKDGELIDVVIAAAPYFLGNETLIQLRVLDSTKRKAAEKRLSAAEKLSAIGQMAAGIAHEVRNPLTTVKGFVQLLQKQMSHSYFDIVVEELDNAIKTLNNLLQVAKPDLDDEQSIPIYLCSELESLIFLFQEKLYNIKVTKIFHDQDKQIMGKKNLLLKAFFNLIKNALESIEGKGELTVEHYYKDGFIHLKFKDSGVGIPEDQIKMLGTPFFSTKNEGTGMGLTQVFTTIHQHGGSINIATKLGQGTTFHLHLPAKPF